MLDINHLTHHNIPKLFEFVCCCSLEISPLFKKTCGFHDIQAYCVVSVLHIFELRERRKQNRTSVRTDGIFIHNNLKTINLQAFSIEGHVDMQLHKISILSKNCWPNLTGWKLYIAAFLI